MRLLLPPSGRGSIFLKRLELFSAAPDYQLHPSRGWLRQRGHRVLLHMCRIVQERPPNDRPVRDLRRRALKAGCAGVSANPSPLRHVDAGAGDVGSLIDIDDFIDRAAVIPIRS